jgi:steroid delta-isomerase-like uncharacterized protein
MGTTIAAENERLARDHFDRVWNRGEFDEGVLTDDYRVHTHLGAHEVHSLAEFREFVAGTREAVPDLYKEPEDVVATEDRVVVRYTMTGTQEGEFRGIPATGGELEIGAVAVYRVEDGRLAESWLVADFLRALRQLGVAD